MNELENVLEYLPKKIKDIIIQSINPRLSEFIEEIRIRLNRPIVLKIGQELMIISYTINSEEMEEIFEKICENSIYSYKNEICEGYITIKGGHRIGLTGTAVIDEKIKNINYISSLNIRIAREKIGSSKNLIEHIIDIDNNTIYNTLIISPPGCGKTTILRDIIRNLSNGIKQLNFSAKTVGIVDERGEIASVYKGIPQKDIGIMSDVMSNLPKSIGMRMLIRSMSPQIIACDEIGNDEDIHVINIAVCSGVKGIFTAHASNIKETMQNPQLNKLIKNNLIDKIIQLNKNNKGKIDKIYNVSNNTFEAIEKTSYLKEENILKSTSI